MNGINCSWTDLSRVSISSARVREWPDAVVSCVIVAIARGKKY